MNKSVGRYTVLLPSLGSNIKIPEITSVSTEHFKEYIVLGKISRNPALFCLYSFVFYEERYKWK